MTSPGKGESMSESIESATTVPAARIVIAAHWAMGAVAALVLVAFGPALGAPRVPILYSAMYSSIRWTLFEIALFGVPLLFVAMVFALTGPTRWAVKDAMRASVAYKRKLLWIWVLMLTAWFMQLAIAAGGVVA